MYGYCKIYSFQIWQSGELRYDFVPARENATGKIGLWNKVEGKMYASASGTPFTAGPLVRGGTPNGELHIAVPENETVSLGDMAEIAGTVNVLKTGAGTLTLPASGQYFIGGLEVADGTLSMTQTPGWMTNATVSATAGGTSVVTGTVTLGGNAISVAGSFAPVSGTAAHTITLADGATLDFTQWAGTFPVAYPTLAYASGANVTLKLEPATAALTALARSKDAETGKRNGYLLSWDEPPSGVTFSPDAATRARFRVVPDESGLRMSFKAGFCIIIK